MWVLVLLVKVKGGSGGRGCFHASVGEVVWEERGTVCGWGGVGAGGRRVGVCEVEGGVIGGRMGSGSGGVAVTGGHGGVGVVGCAMHLGLYQYQALLAARDEMRILLL